MADLPPFWRLSRAVEGRKEGVLQRRVLHGLAHVGVHLARSTPNFARRTGRPPPWREVATSRIRGCDLEIEILRG